jgi:hypothetical protein
MFYHIKDPLNEFGQSTHGLTYETIAFCFSFTAQNIQKMIFWYAYCETDILGQRLQAKIFKMI